MDIPLRVLIIEDSDRDVALEVRALKAAGYRVTYAVAETAAEMKAALAEQAFDIVISDHDLPQFDAPGALAVLKQSGLDIPFIIVSGAIGEETAVALMKAGAHDYVMKDRLARLASAVEHALKDAENLNGHKQVEEALRESEAKYRSILENMEDVYYELDLHGNLVFFNDALISKTGYSREALMGMNYRQYISPETYKPVQRVFSEIYKTGRQVGLFEYEILMKGGQTRNYESWASLLFDNNNQPIGFRGIARDITDRKRAESALQESEEKYRSLVENISDVIYELDSQGVVVYISPVARDILGYDSAEIVGKNFIEFVYKDDQSRLAERFSELRKGIEYPSEYRFVNKSGEIRWVRTKTSPIMEDGLFKGARGTLIDVTDQRHAEEELQRTLESLRKAFGATIQVMVSAVESRDPYTAGHQIRSANLARCIATEMGLPQEKIEGIRMAGSIHDIGKLSIPAEILSKPTKLTEIEFSLIKEHSRKGYEMLRDVESPWPLAQIVYQHHERIDGSGYPRNLKGDDILIEARIMAVADVVESMASHRPYRPARGIDPALEEIEKNRGTLYDNTVADACLRLFREKGFKLEGA